MIIIYNLSIRILGFLMFFASFFNEKAKKWQSGRKDIFIKLNSSFARNDKPVLWFHCASLGEFEQGRPLIEKFKDLKTHFKILITFYSPSGYEVRKNYEYADWVFYLPQDTANNAALFIDIVKPSAAFFIKYEFWLHYINELYLKSIPAYSVSSIFRNDQIFFKPYGSLMRETLKKLSMIFVQNEQSVKLLETIEVQSIRVGDTRFDRVKTIYDNRQELKIIKRFKGKNRLFVIGSSWEQDMKILIPLLNDIYMLKATIGHLKVVIAPHEINVAAIKAMITQIDRSSILYSEASNKDLSLHDIMVIDNIGLLSSIYQYADFAYIGGAFGKGLHNILEAATYGMPLFFGPKFTRFQEAQDLVASGGAFSVNSVDKMAEIFVKLASIEESRIKCAEITQKYVQNNTGASEIIFSYLNAKIGGLKSAE